MTFLLKAGAAFGLAALLNGTFPLDTPRWHEVAGELQAARPQARLAAQADGLIPAMPPVR